MIGAEKPTKRMVLFEINKCGCLAGEKKLFGAGRSANEVVPTYLSEIYTPKAVPQVAWRVWKRWDCPFGWADALTPTIERH